MNDLIKQECNELLKELLDEPEVQEFLEYKKLLKDSQEIKDLKQKIAKLSSENKIEERNNLLQIYNSNPLVINYNNALENVKEILLNIKDIIKF